MFKIKNNLLFLNVFLFIGLVLLFVINNHQVMAMENNYTNSAQQNIAINNNKIREYTTERNNIIEYILMTDEELQGGRLQNLIKLRDNYTELISNLQQQNALFHSIIENNRHR